MNKTDNWLPKIAIVTFAYYCLSFAFEIGYFWKVGVGYMPAFSISEHTVHAASSTLAVLGIVTISYFVIMYPAVWLDTNSSPPPMKPPPPKHAIHWMNRLSFIMIVALFSTTYAWDEVPRLIQEGLYPTSLFGLVASIAMLAYFAMISFRVPNIFWIYPAIIAAVISPVALGQMVYDSFVDGDRAVDTTVTIAGKPVGARVIFMGTDRMLVAGPRAPILVGYPDDAVTLR